MTEVRSQTLEVSSLRSVVTEAIALCAMLLALCDPAGAQQPGKIFRIGFLDASTGSGMAALIDTFRQELSKAGWVDGRTISIEYRFAEQKNERLPELAAELVRHNVDLIVVTSSYSQKVWK